MGSLIWCLQTRFDVGFAVTEFATSSPYVLSDETLILGMVKMLNRTICTLKNRVVEICFGGFFDSHQEVTRELLGPIRLFVFNDAGYGALRGSRSVEAAIIVDGKEISRDGSII